jgi:hypothetical protein
MGRKKTFVRPHVRDDDERIVASALAWRNRGYHAVRALTLWSQPSELITSDDTLNMTLYHCFMTCGEVNHALPLLCDGVYP